MPWRLILFAVFIVLLVAFVGVNLENTCAVSLIFVTYPDVPVYISILISFALGMLIMIPFTFGRKSSRQKPERPETGRPVYTDKMTGSTSKRNRTVPADKNTDAAEASSVVQPLNND